MQVLLLHLDEGKSTSVTLGWAPGLQFWPLLKSKTSTSLMRCELQTWLYFSLFSSKTHCLNQRVKETMYLHHDMLLPSDSWQRQ